MRGDFGEEDLPNGLFQSVERGLDLPDSKAKFKAFVRDCLRIAADSSQIALGDALEDQTV